MLQTTPTGHDVMLHAVTETLFTVHLFVTDGELSGYGYQPERIDTSLWQDGVYPDITWEFDAGEKPTRVLGYYVAGDDGAMLYSENFPASTENEDDEPGYTIGRQGDRIVVGLRLNLFVSQAA